MPSLTFLSSSVFLVLQHHQNPLLISRLSFSFITQLSHTILNFWSMLRNEVYRATRPTEDTITTTLLTVVLSYTRLLFVDFNLPHKLVTKLTVSSHFWSDFLSLWLPKGESRLLQVLSPQSQHRLFTGMCAESLLFILYTHNCTPTHSSNNLIKFPDDTTLMGLI